MTDDDLEFKLLRIESLVSALSILVHDLSSIPLAPGSPEYRTRQAVIGVTYALEGETGILDGWTGETA